MFSGYQLSWKEKVGYSLSDMASNVYWRVFDLFLFIFYTMGLAYLQVLAIRLIDAISVPLTEALADRTKTRCDKCHSYLMRGAIPLSVTDVLTFTVPDLDDEFS